MANYIIRPATPPDIEAIITLCEEHAGFEGKAYNRDRKAERLAKLLFADQPQMFCLVVETPAGVVGYATYMVELSTWDAANYMHMECLFLRPEVHGRGIGTQIIQRIAQEAQQHDCVEIQWQTPQFNTPAIAFYKRIGATSRDKVRFYLAPGVIANGT